MDESRIAEAEAEQVAELRREFHIPEDATEADVLKAIYDTGWTPHPAQVIVGGKPAFVCPVQRGIFVTCQLHESGAMGQQPTRSSILAALLGLKRARG